VWRAVAQGGVAAVKVGVDVEVISYFQAGFFKQGKGGVLRRQLGFKRAAARFGLGVARSATSGQGPGLHDAGAAGLTGIVTALVGVDDGPRSRLAQRQGLFQYVEYQLGRHLGGQVPTHDLARVGVTPNG